MPKTLTMATRKLWGYRIAGGGVVLLVSGIASYFHDQAPWLMWFAELVAAIVGKLVGVPFAEVTQLALRKMTPERAVDVTIAALESHPPEATEAAATRLLASLPPEARARASIEPPASHVRAIQFTGLDGSDP